MFSNLELGLSMIFGLSVSRHFITKNTQFFFSIRNLAFLWFFSHGVSREQFYRNKGSQRKESFKEIKEDPFLPMFPYCLMGSP